MKRKKKSLKKHIEIRTLGKLSYNNNYCTFFFLFEETRLGRIETEEQYASETNHTHTQPTYENYALGLRLATKKRYLWGRENENYTHLTNIGTYSEANKKQQQTS